jgi:hypothetical protein
LSEKNSRATSPLGSLGEEGAERYMWEFSEGNSVVLAIPELRDLTLDADKERNHDELAQLLHQRPE